MAVLVTFFVECSSELGIPWNVLESESKCFNYSRMASEHYIEQLVGAVCHDLDDDGE